MVRFPARVLILLFLFNLVMPSANAFSIDLHSHVFMKDGMSFLLRGDFDEPTRSKDARSFLSTKFTRESLEPSGLRLVVVSIYAHPILKWGSQKESLLREVSRLEEFVAKNPKWVIASEPWEARAALATGKKVFVLSLETAADIVETKADQDLFIDEKKIRIVTFMHLSPDRLGRGVSLWPGIGIFNAPLENIEAWITKARDAVTGVYVNPYGLSDYGKTVLESLVKRRVWIDLAHASDRAERDMVEVLDRYGQPSLFTHTKLRELAASERAVPRFALERVKNTAGIVGLIPTDDMEAELPDSFDLPAMCRVGIQGFAEEWKRTVKITGAPERVALGSDFNAPLHGLRGGCPAVKVASNPSFEKTGFFRGDDLPLLDEAMKSVGVDPEPKPDLAIEAFLRAWEKVRGPLGKKTQSP
jgi:microsomal dipeptidase-like Zn-dependent dipeptidase